ncbi:aldose 1-epimerase [Aureibaculum algae]|uniref:Aldose 1-epimerase n=1 Tax=Aureibaculum algae TaxID=2584122 RepID=A0A5B7U0B8_9FLAO|nr:aldose 1-epimerase [Aureibaculum algae]QCX40372.1 aldose 1-epimerase [Aureibaculum algae]
MFRIKHLRDLNQLEIKNSENNLHAKIHLDDGASLQELTLKGHHIIKSLSPLDYADTYASSILFPFANRIKDGKYEFEGNSYQFNINEPDNNNALHGMVYNKRFVFIDEKITGSGASVKLAYHETQSSTGFPFTYSIYLEYVFTQSTLDLNVEIRNTDFKIFPFTLGWHPYFISDDLYNSSFLFDSNLKLKLDNRNITEGIINNENHNNFKMKDQFLDDCFILKTQNVSFLTPSYSLELRTSEKNSFLQLYTPPHKNAIAIEPTTGVSDSFNNEIGLKILKPNEGYKISWTLELK